MWRPRRAGFRLIGNLRLQVPAPVFGTAQFVQRGSGLSDTPAAFTDVVFVLFERCGGIPFGLRSLRAFRGVRQRRFILRQRRLRSIDGRPGVLEPFAVVGDFLAHHQRQVESVEAVRVQVGPQVRQRGFQLGALAGEFGPSLGQVFHRLVERAAGIRQVAHLA